MGESVPVSARNISVAIQRGGVCWGAILVRIEKKGEIYEIYVNDVTRVGQPRKAHISYHASGQRHYKVDGRYICWSEGASGENERMIAHRPRPETVIGREQIGRFLSFDIARVDSTLTPLPESADMIIDASGFEPASILAFAVSIVGPFAEPRADSNGFPIIEWQRFIHGAIIVEIEAFRITEEFADRAW